MASVIDPGPGIAAPAAPAAPAKANNERDDPSDQVAFSVGVNRFS